MKHEGHVRVGIRMAMGRPGRSVRRAIRLRCAVPRDLYIVDARVLQDGAARDTPPCKERLISHSPLSPSHFVRVTVRSGRWLVVQMLVRPAQPTPLLCEVLCLSARAVAVALRSAPRPYSERPVVPARLPGASPSPSSLHRLHPHTPPRPAFLLTRLAHSPCILAVLVLRLVASGWWLVAGGTRIHIHEYECLHDPSVHDSFSFAGHRPPARPAI